ncbi:hypothetical protein [Lentzea sp. E54]|uniref:hypothetical protein n=1 Tax=Lentzea xerophila TaxID=3435883 RepID=UPI003DA3DC16
MVFLRIVRIALIVLGIIAAALGIILIAVDAKVSGGPLEASWSCTNSGSGTTARMTCKTQSARYSGPSGLTDTISYLGLTIGGVALIGAAVAIGQFDRTRIAAAPAQRPGPMHSGPPFPGPGPQVPPGQQHGFGPRP